MSTFTRFIIIGCLIFVINFFPTTAFSDPSEYLKNSRQTLMATYDLQMQDIARQYSSGQISTEKFNDFCNQLKNRMMSDIQKERELGVQIEISNDTQIVRKIRERLKNPVGLTVEELQEIVGTESETSGPHK